jgi:hypothetical protein
VAGKPTAPTEDAWRQAIANFKRNRDFDRTEFRAEAEALVSELEREAASADDTAVRMEREQAAVLAAHDKTAIIKRLTDNGHRKQLLDLAGLDLLILDPIAPWLEEADPHGRLGLSGLMGEPDDTSDVVGRQRVIRPADALVVTGNVTAEQLACAGELHEILARWGLDSFGDPIRQRPSVLLRRQADLLLGGAARVQHLVDDHVTRANAIKPAVSVALHELFETTEPWDVETIEIARQLVKADVRPGRDDGRGDIVPRPISAREREALIKKWNANLRQLRPDWQERMKAKRPANN